MENIRIINVCKKCKSSGDWIEAPNSDDDLFICRVCGHHQCLIEEVDLKTLLEKKGK